MSDTEQTEQEATQDSAKKKSAAPVIFVVLLVLGAVVFGGLYASSQKSKEAGSSNDYATVSDESETLAEDAGVSEIVENASEELPASDDVVTDETVDEPAQEIEDEASITPETSAPKDNAALAALAAPRILGNPESPVRIAEHSSFTCGGCGAFHATNFKQIKEEYIDTGKAHLVFDDFPRNLIDLEVGMAARCLPESGYFNFVQLMFETQKQWAHADKYETYLRQNAAMAGLDAAALETCLANEGLKKAMTDSSAKAHMDFGVNSTPTLVINNAVVLSGLAPYDKIKQAIDNALAQSGQ